ncbi:hypothetical protein C6497_04300 [Candidatus Poribacteria bacterium]|nr:MAG: hypothetical protein C6497_04300 [Candidatus Poribacteria bacterium]
MGAEGVVWLSESRISRMTRNTRIRGLSGGKWTDYKITDWGKGWFGCLNNQINFECAESTV